MMPPSANGYQLSWSISSLGSVVFIRVRGRATTCTNETSFRNVISKHPFMKTQDPVHPFGQPFIMRGNNSRRAFLPHEAEEFSKNDIGSMFVQIAGRLVKIGRESCRERVCQYV